MLLQVRGKTMLSDSPGSLPLSTGRVTLGKSCHVSGTHGEAFVDSVRCDDAWITLTESGADGPPCGRNCYYWLVLARPTLPLPILTDLGEEATMMELNDQRVGWATCPGLPRTFLVLALKVPCPGNPLSPGHTGTRGHSLGKTSLGGRPQDLCQSLEIAPPYCSQKVRWRNKSTTATEGTRHV